MPPLGYEATERTRIRFNEREKTLKEMMLFGFGFFYVNQETMELIAKNGDTFSSVFRKLLLRIVYSIFDGQRNNYEHLMGS